MATRKVDFDSSQKTLLKNQCPTVTDQIIGALVTRLNYECAIPECEEGKYFWEYELPEVIIRVYFIASTPDGAYPVGAIKVIATKSTPKAL